VGLEAEFIEVIMSSLDIVTDSKYRKSAGI